MRHVAPRAEKLPLRSASLRLVRRSPTCDQLRLLAGGKDTIFSVQKASGRPNHDSGGFSLSSLTSSEARNDFVQQSVVALLRALDVVFGGAPSPWRSSAAGCGSRTARTSARSQRSGSSRGSTSRGPGCRAPSVGFAPISCETSFRSRSPCSGIRPKTASSRASGSRRCSSWSARCWRTVSARAVPSLATWCRSRTAWRSRLPARSSSGLVGVATATETMGVVVTGLVASQIAAHLGKTLDDARLQRDRAHDQKEQAEELAALLAQNSRSLEQALASLREEIEERARISLSSGKRRSSRRSDVSPPGWRTRLIPPCSSSKTTYSSCSSRRRMSSP